MVASALLVSTAPTATAPSATESSSVAPNNVIPLRRTVVEQAMANESAADQAAASTACPTVTHRIPAGWYPDRENASRRRWWSGTEWTEHYAVPRAELATEPRPADVPADVHPVGTSPRHSTGPQRVTSALTADTARPQVPLVVIVLLAALTGADAVLLCLLALAN